MDQRRVQGLERRVVEAEPREATGPEVLDEHVAAAEQAPEDLGARPRP